MKEGWRKTLDDRLKDEIHKKKIELFDELLMTACCPQAASFAFTIILGKYKTFCGELNHKYLAELKKLCPREYEKLMLSTRLLRFRAEKQELLELLNEF